MRQIKLNRQKLGVEDLLFGTGTEEQTRGNQQAIVTKINAGNLPFDETRSLIEFTQQVNLELLGNSITELLNINANLSGLLNIDPYQFNKLGFKTNVNETVTTGQVAWNQQESTIDVGLNSSVTLQVGQEELALVKNSTGNTITNGKVVMVVGSNGNSGNLLVALHDGTKVNAVPTLGITTQEIANEASGFVTKSGKVRGINTSGSTVGEKWVDGDVLYVSTNGNLTKVVPSDTALKMAIAVVINAQGSNGTLFVRTNGLDENHDKDWVNAGLSLKADTASLGTAAYANILGTVSQTGGVPTGAIIESGSNVNGRYTKFADGTMICTSNLLGNGFIDIPMGYLFRTPIVVWIFPATFSGDPRYIAKNGAETAGVGSCYVARGDGSSETLASASFYFLRPSAVYTEPAGIFTAIGRWF